MSLEKALDTKSHQVWTPSPSLDGLKSSRIKIIKQEAGDRISALDWKVTRATEQPDLYSKSDIMAERQGIRDSSSTAELDVDALATIEEIKQFTW